MPVNAAGEWWASVSHTPRFLNWGLFIMTKIFSADSTNTDQLKCTSRSSTPEKEALWWTMLWWVAWYIPGVV